MPYKDPQKQKLAKRASERRRRAAGKAKPKPPSPPVNPKGSAPGTVSAEPNAEPNPEPETVDRSDFALRTLDDVLSAYENSRRLAAHPMVDPVIRAGIEIRAATAASRTLEGADAQQRLEEALKLLDEIKIERSARTT